MGKFMVVPSAPGLSTIDKDVKYWCSLKESDFAIQDSGFMVLLAYIFFRIKLKKLSGPKFLRLFLNEDILRNEGILVSIDPSKKESTINNDYLNSIGIPIKKDMHYIAPIYNEKDICDEALLALLESFEVRPKFLLINIAGGFQERLGFYIKNNLSYKIGIICTGAAIAFETGQQARLPKLVDDCYMGWFARICQNPLKYSMRYIKAIRLIYVFYIWKINKLL